MEWLARLLGSRWRAPALGEEEARGRVGGYCGGRDVDECRRAFGEQNLPAICATCPD